MNDSLFEQALDFARNHRASEVQLDLPAPRFGTAADLTPEEHESLEFFIRAFAPWRKGPFNLFGHRIDGNWKSDEKWKRIITFMDDPEGRRIADIGCNNGYYMFRLLGAGAEGVVGMDPTRDCKRMYEFLESFHAQTCLEYRQSGYVALEGYAQAFDIVLCMGLIYHHRDPVEIFRAAFQALKPGGQIIVESLGLSEMRKDRISVPRMQSSMPSPGYCLIPAGRYAGMKGIWHVPEPSCSIAWLRRSGFRDVRFEGEHEFANHQQKTDYADMPVLNDGLDLEDPEITIEGYPAPVRFYCSARR